MSAILKLIRPWLVLCVCVFGALQWAYQTGYERRSSEVAESVREATESQRIETERNRLDAQKRETELLAQLASMKEVAQSRARALKTHLKTQQKPKESPNAEDPDHDTPTLLGSVVLDARTVGLLNAARANAELEDSDPAGGADEASAATAITVADFAMNDLEVVRLYHELSARHSGLADWVRSQAQCLAPPVAK